MKGTIMYIRKMKRRFIVFMQITQLAVEKLV